jgi:hypothetical protein
MFQKLPNTRLDPETLAAILKKYDLKVVILERPYDHIDDPMVQFLLGKIAEMKIHGYRGLYPYGTIPFDKSDLFANHMLLCEAMPNGQLVPLTGMKSVTEKVCEEFHMEFPVWSILSAPEAAPHREAVRAILEQARAEGKSPSYNGSWTMSERAKQVPELRMLCHDISTSFLLSYYTTYALLPCFAGATSRFKVQKIKEPLGYEYLKANGERLPAVPCKPFFGEEIDLMVLLKPGIEAMAWLKLFDGLWSTRFTITAPEQISAKPLEKVA